MIWVGCLHQLLKDAALVVGGFSGLASTLQLSKVTLRGDDVTDMPLEIGEADVTDLVVTFVRSSFAAVSGTVTGNFADTTVVFFPADRRLWVEPAAARRWFSFVPVSRAGNFSSGQFLLPGDYFVALVPDEQAADFQQQSKLEALAVRAQKVTLAAGEAKTIEVRR